MKPKLYQYTACPFCSKVRTLLQYKGVDYDVIEVHPLKKTEIAFSADYKAVPIYIDSRGKQVNDSTPIMRWIDKEFPDYQVFGASPRDIEKEEKWLAWSDRFVKGLPTAIYDTFPNALKSFNYITQVGKFSWFEKRMIKYSGALVMTLVAKKIKKRENITQPDLFLKEKAKEWVEGLSGRPFMGGITPGGADIAVFGIVRSVAGLRAGALLEENLEFKTWMEKMQGTVNTPKGLQYAKS